MNGHIEPTESGELPSDVTELFERLAEAMKAERRAAMLHLPVSRQLPCVQCGRLQNASDHIIKTIRIRFEEVILQRDGARGALRRTMARLPQAIADPEATFGSG